MSERTVLITGATGLLGREVATTFGLKNWNVKGTGYSRADGINTFKVNLRNETEVGEFLDETKFAVPSLYGCCASRLTLLPTFRPQVIVHCAAQRFPDKVDKDPEGARELNVAASKALAKLAADRDIFVIYISTDYVFPGTPGDAPYEADAKPHPTNLYGQTKLDGERAVLDTLKQAGKEGLGVVLRVPVLYGNAETPAESAVNVLMDALWKAQTQGAEISMDHWAIRYPTNTEDIGRVCHVLPKLFEGKQVREKIPLTSSTDISVKYLDAPTRERSCLPRVLQFSSEDRMTKYEIVSLFGEIMGLSTEGIKPNTEGNDPNASVQRPYDCHLSTKALKDLGIDVSTCDFKGWWRREVRAFRK
ncbi:dTDP-4-dehydrorhamnose reductase [Fusarium phyllophilum]|uniref:dTDP-4-dehydrorhamnose reductase n=1 Tax=Fusarium phyllophilum TaxID=47803 RepID=A0A8H5MYE5_9HYPO|nr:dTDP-4-dehydrorhamnose reductase [Fusarium phyllophilum]